MTRVRTTIQCASFYYNATTRGTPADAPLIQQCMRDARMNPLFLDPSNFLVAESAVEGVQGFGQIRPVAFGASEAFELASVYTLVRWKGGFGVRLVLLVLLLLCYASM